MYVTISIAIEVEWRLDSAIGFDLLKFVLCVDAVESAIYRGECYFNVEQLQFDTWWFQHFSHRFHQYIYSRVHQSLLFSDSGFTLVPQQPICIYFEYPVVTTTDYSLSSISITVMPHSYLFVTEYCLAVTKFASVAL